ncbi:MAG TPA: efflux transporter outer membrane subunit [Caulobacteraceae bacterium]|jgi:NodT family efflux transporter outer membrane factor (OMF) lipoprotein
MSQSRPAATTRIPRLMAAAATLAIASAALAACQVGPDFKGPAAPSATAGYTAGGLPAAIAPDQRLASGADVPGRWWEVYGSPELNALMDQAIKASPDIQSAEAALRSAHELYLAQHGALLPTVDAGYNVTRQKFSDEIAPPALNSDANPYTLHTLQLNVGYTPDVFGGLHRQQESALAQTEAQRFQAEAAYLTLTANVAAAAIQQASLIAQVRDAEALAASDRKTLDALRRSQQQGELAAADVAAQEVIVAQAEQGLPPLNKQLAQQNDLIAYLTGRTPAEAAIPALDLDKLALPAELPVTLPSDLVRHRPDVQAAEANLHAASANVGVAIAARLPTFPLTANVGSQSADLGGLFSSPNIFWTVTGAMAQPIFEGGQLKHKQKSAEALLDQAKAQYRGAALAAFQNVADSLQALQGDARALDAAAAVDQAAGRSRSAAQKQLDAGEASVLPLLAAEQAQLQARAALTQARAARLADTAALYQSLGGGWWNRTDFAEADAAGGKPAAQR